MSTDLILRYPKSYLRVASEGWSRFWGLAFYHYDPVPSGPGQWFESLTWPSIQTFLNLLFWAASAISMIKVVRADRGPRSYTGSKKWGDIALVVVTVWFAAAISSLTNFQDNARLRTYTLPLQYGIVWVVSSQAVEWLRARAPRAPADRPKPSAANP